ncbi:MAG: ATP-binding cassette domain-containing protein, partial [Cutibacterium sp.]|nr:ATP-binding cassette domain-containing protein [Cutibacterium sp.]
MTSVSESPPGLDPAIANPAEAPFFSVSDLSIGFGASTAVRNVDLALARGEILAIVGESGCGKSMTALAIAGLLPRAAQRISGRITMDGVALHMLDPPAMRTVRGRDLAMIFQE